MVTIIINYHLEYYLLEVALWMNQYSQVLFKHQNMQNYHTLTHPLKPSVTSFVIPDFLR